DLLPSRMGRDRARSGHWLRACSGHLPWLSDLARTKKRPVEPAHPGEAAMSKRSRVVYLLLSLIVAFGVQVGTARAGTAAFPDRLVVTDNSTGTVLYDQSLTEGQDGGTPLPDPRPPGGGTLGPERLLFSQSKLVPEWPPTHFQ